MKKVSCWNDLVPYGIDPLTGEACGLMWRILCDVTAKGKKTLEKCFGILSLSLPENWNSGDSDDPHVGSIMLAPELLMTIAVFALLEDGCAEVWKIREEAAVGIEPCDNRESCIEWIKEFYGTQHVRRLAYQGTCGDRNRHSITGRIV